MKRKFNMGCCLLLCFVGISPGQAQDTLNIKQVSEQFKRMQDVYKNAGAISYRLHYTYANESTPAVILDSLSGEVDMNGNNYHSILDSTETITNERYAIILFKKDRLMYLARPSKNQAAFNALSMLDSTLAAIQGLQCIVSTTNDARVVTLQFPPQMKYKKIKFIEDTLTGYLREIKYVVKANQLLDPQVAKTAGNAGYDEYGIVDVQLLEYRKNAVDNSFFNENVFFHKEGKEYKTTQAYKDYKIFLGTPNL